MCTCTFLMFPVDFTIDEIWSSKLHLLSADPPLCLSLGGCSLSLLLCKISSPLFVFWLFISRYKTQLNAIMSSSPMRVHSCPFRPLKGAWIWGNTELFYSTRPTTWAAWKPSFIFPFSSLLKCSILPDAGTCSFNLFQRRCGTLYDYCFHMQSFHLA